MKLGFAYDPLCVYVNGTGRDYYEFYIQLNRCGTLGGNTHNLDSRKQPTVRFQVQPLRTASVPFDMKTKDICRSWVIVAG
jgi:hypothetical protein